MLAALVASTALLALAAGCTAPDGGAAIGGGARSALAECRVGDREVASASACLVDDAACYELASGAFCTGPRGGVCPAGSTALAAGAACPPGKRCIRTGESLECIIG